MDIFNKSKSSALFSSLDKTLVSLPPLQSISRVKQLSKKGGLSAVPNKLCASLLVSGVDFIVVHAC